MQFQIYLFLIFTSKKKETKTTRCHWQQPAFETFLQHIIWESFISLWAGAKTHFAAPVSQSSNLFQTKPVNMLFRVRAKNTSWCSGAKQVITFSLWEMTNVRNIHMRNFTWGFHINLRQHPNLPSHRWGMRDTCWLLSLVPGSQACITPLCSIALGTFLYNPCAALQPGLRGALQDHTSHWGSVLCGTLLRSHWWARKPFAI